jgi:lipopolysaccharide/colanic/teichoic acid biosynthesis glycosyltransferase
MDQLHVNQISSTHCFYLTFKRILDVSICLLILPFALPLMVIIGILIFFDSPGPILVQERVGRMVPISHL